MDLSKILGGLVGGGMIGGGLGSLFGHQNNNPADAAMNYYNQIPGAVKPYYDPYINAGKKAMGQYGSESSNLVSHTGDIYNRLAGGYKESPGYKFQLEQGLQAGKNAAASGGMLGTPQNQQQQTQIANDIASQDFQKYLQNQMGLYGLGMGGLGNMTGLGFGASKGLADTLGTNLAQQGGMSFLGQQGQNQANQGGWSNIGSGIGALLSLFGIPGMK